MLAYGRPPRRLDYRALTAVALSAALPVLIGVLLTAGPSDSARPRPAVGHWVYVPDQGVAVHVDGAAKRVDATVAVGSATTGSPVLADQRAAYLVDDHRVIVFGDDGVTGDTPAVAAAEPPVPVEADDAAYLVYRAAGLVVRLGPEPVTIRAGGRLGVPIVTPTGELWTYRLDSGELCVLAGVELDCPARVPAEHAGALTVLDGEPGFLDVTASTWLPVRGRPVPLGATLPANAAVGAAAVAGRIPVIDPAEHRLLLVGTRGDVVVVPLGDGRFATPLTVGGAVAAVNTDSGTITSYDANGQRRAQVTVPGGVRLTTGADGRGYADSTDGLQTVVLDGDGTLTAVRTTGETPTTHSSPTATPSVALPPATVAVTTTEAVPAAPETVTVSPGTSAAPTSAAGTPPPNAADTGTPAPPAGPPATPGRPSVDVLGAEPAGPGRARVQVRVSGTDPVFCHVYFNSVERAATRCGGTMTVDVAGLAPGTAYDIYVLGTNAAGTGAPGRRGELRT